MAIIQIARLGKLFIGEEATYGVAPTLTAANAFRHIEYTHSHNNNRSNSLEKRGTPGLLDRFSRHIEAGVNLSSAYLSPSGTIGTEPEGKLIFLNGMGAKRVGTVSTTVASSPTTTGATLTTGTGLTTDDFVAINCTGGSAPGLYVRKLTSVAGAVVTWAPALPQAPVATNTVKAGVAYSLANTLPKSLTFARYLPNLSYEHNGAVLDKLSFMFDGNDEAKFSCSGPAKAQASSAQAQPGSFTTVGSPVTGIAGSLFINGVAEDILKVNAEINNAMKLDNETFGTDRARNYYRVGRRDVTLGLDLRLSDDTTVYDAALAASDVSLIVQCGTVEGRICGIYCPRLEFDVPDVPDGDGDLTLGFKAVAKETIGNDELYLFFC
jgi:hypothetical protein